MLLNFAYLVKFNLDLVQFQFIITWYDLGEKVYDMLVVGCQEEYKPGTYRWRYSLLAQTRKVKINPRVSKLTTLLYRNIFHLFMDLHIYLLMFKYKI